MDKKEYIEGIHQVVENLNFNFDRLNKILFLIEEEIVLLMKKIENTSFEESVALFDHLETYKTIVAKCYYNRNKIEISEKLFLFMTDFERSELFIEKRRIWNQLKEGKHVLFDKF